jgi:hypothetical protein
MSYRALIDKSLQQAFNTIKDLAVDVTFNKVAVGDFNFSTGQATEVSTPVSAKAVIFNKNKSQGGKERRNAVRMEIMFKTAEIGSDITGFDTVTIGSDTWKVGDPLKDDGSIMMLQLYKEV